MAGIQETKELVAFSISLIQTAVEVAKDGKVGLSDIVTLMSALKDAPSALSGVDKIPAELKDLDDVELAELVSYIKLKFDLPNDLIEAQIEVAFDVAAALAKALLKWPKPAVVA